MHVVLFIILFSAACVVCVRACFCLIALLLHKKNEKNNNLT